MSIANLSEQLQITKDQDPWIPNLYEVASTKMEIDNLITLVLEPFHNYGIAPMRPGQFNMIYFPGVGEIPISVSSLRGIHPELTHTIQNVGAVSKACTKVQVGDVLGVRGPFGTHWPVEKAKGKDVLIQAGGLGLAPLRPLIEEVLKYRDEFGEVNILYGTRSPKSIAFHEDIITWQSDPSLNFHLTVDHAFDNWRGNVGVVTNLMNQTKFDPLNTMAFVCGPEIMMRYGVHSCLDADIPEDNIYLSMERNMKCAIGFCGHCQFGSLFVCKDGAVFDYPRIKKYLNISGI